VTRVKMKVQAPMDAMLHPWFAIGRIWFRISSQIPDISWFSTLTIGILQPPETVRVTLEYFYKSFVVIISRVHAGDSVLWKVPRANMTSHNVVVRCTELFQQFIAIYAF
jgi:hypothetical protein